MPYYPLKELYPHQRTQVAVGRQRQQRQSVPTQVIAEEEAKKEQEPIELALAAQEKPVASEEPQAESRRQMTVADLTPEQKAEHDKIDQEARESLKPIEAELITKKAQWQELYAKAMSTSIKDVEGKPAQYTGLTESEQSEYLELGDNIREIQNEYDAMARAYQEKLLAAAGVTRAYSGPTTQEAAQAYEQTTVMGKGGETAFNYAKDKGLIPKDAIYVPRAGTKWGYITPAQQREQINQLVTAGVLTTEDLRGLDLNTDLSGKLKLAVDTYNKKQFQNTVNDLVSKGVLDTQALRDIGGDPAKIQPYVDAYNRTRQSALDRISKYQLGEDNYDLVAAINAGVSKNDLQLAGFDDTDIDMAAGLAGRPVQTSTPTTRPQQITSQTDLDKAWRDIKRDKNLPDNAKLLSYDNATGEFNYEIPAGKAYITTQEDLDKAWAEVKKENKIPEEAKLISYDNATGEFNYETTRKITVPQTESINEKLENINKTTSIRDVWRMVTPWDEEKGENVFDYAKGWPARYKESLNQMLHPPKSETQLELKSQYEMQEQSRKAVFKQDTPMWAKVFLLATNESKVAYNGKTDTYSRVKAGDAPVTGAKGKVLLLTLPRLNWKAIQEAIEKLPQIKKVNPKVSWKAINDAIARSKRIPATEVDRDIMRVIPETEAFEGGGKPGTGVLAPLSRSLKMRLGIIKPVAVMASLSVIDKKTITQLANNVNEIHRDKVYAKPDVREARDGTKPDVRSIKIGEPTPSISPAVKTKAKPITTTLESRKITPLKGVIPIISSVVMPTIVTDTKAQPITDTLQATQVQIRTIAKADTAADIGTKTASKAAAAIKVKTETKVATDTVTDKKTAARSGGGDKYRRKALAGLNLNELPDPEKRQAIADAGGAFTWRQGKLSGKPVHHVVVNPFRQQDKTTVLGKAPEGAVNVTGIGQAKRSLRLTRGLAPKKSIRYEGGAVDPVVSPVGKRKVAIRFVPDRSVMRRTNIKQTKPPRFAFRSRKVGRVFHTQVGGGTVLSRRPLGRKR